MGAASSNPVEGDFERRSNSITRSSNKRRSSQPKIDQIENASKVVGNLKNEIDIFAGGRADSRYKEFQKMLTKFAEDLQKIKNGSKKPQCIQRSDEVLGEVQNCLQRLETRVNMNEQNENSLDLGSVESHSFIHNYNQRPPPPALLIQQLPGGLPPPSKRKQQNFSQSLEDVELQTQNLIKDIKRSVELEDTKEFVIYEGKIKILYADLEMIRIEEHTPLDERKAAIGKRLIKYNNQLKTIKRNLEKKAKAQATTQDGSGFSKPATQKKEEVQVDAYTKLEYILEELEVQALTFEGVKSDKRYKELEQILESHWTKLYSMDSFGEEEQNKRSITVERTKNILQELRKRAEENEKQLKAIKSIHNIEQEFQGVKKEAAAFKGTTKDSPYTKLDQDLRGLWAKVSQVEEPNEHVRRSKSRVITEIQYVLKNLSQDSKNREIYANVEVIPKLEPPTKSSSSADDAIHGEIVQKQLLEQVKEFQNHWNQLNHNLDIQEISKSEISLSIIDIFDRVLDGVTKKRIALSKIEKRKSNSSLVIAKVIDNTDQLTKLQPTYIHKSAATTTVTDAGKYYGNPKMFTSFKPTTGLTYQSHYQPPDLIQQQPISPPLVKLMETEIKVQPSVKTIGEMQRVGTEAKSLLQQIRQLNCTKHDSEYKILETKLKQCQLTLQGIEYNKRSETIESNRRRASKTINEAFRALEEKASKSALDQEKAAAIRSSKAQEIMDIDAGIQYFRQQIKNFVGVTKDKQYEKIKQGLADSFGRLQVIDDVHMSKKESIQQIQQYHQELETKLAENQAKVKLSEQNADMRRQTAQGIKGVVEQVQKLRSQIDRFTGPYQGLLYKQIEGNLTSCLEKLEALDAKGDDKLQNGIFQTNQKIHKYLRILEDKSTKPSTFGEGSSPDQAKPHQEQVVKEEVQHLKARSVPVEQHNSVTQQDTSLPKQEHPITSSASTQPDVVHRQKIQRQSQVSDPDSPHNKINSLRDKLVDVKNKTETFSGNYKDGEYSEIENQLLGYFEELRAIDDRGHKSVIISKEQYADYIEKLLVYFEEKVKTPEGFREETITNTEETKTSNQMSIMQPTQSFKVNDPTEELAAIEEKIQELKAQVNGFEGTTNHVLYKVLEQAFTAHVAELESVQPGNVAHVREKKTKLLQELKDCTKLLEEKASSQQEATDQEQLEKINAVLEELQEISPEVYNFVGVKNDKEYCYLDELLIRFTIQLDSTQTYGKVELRNARKKVIRDIQRHMEMLTKRAAPKEDVSVEVKPSLV